MYALSSALKQAEGRALLSDISERRGTNSVYCFYNRLGMCFSKECNALL